MKTVINQIRRNAWLAVAALLAFTSCQENGEAGQLPEGKHPLTFTAAVAGLTMTKATTRATTTDNAFAGGEAVAVQVDNEVSEYTASTGGALSSNMPFYWQSSSDSKTVSAWYASSYSATRPTTLSVEADQSNLGYETSDLLYAAPNTIAYTDATKQLTFKHLTAKVVINLTNGTDVTADAVRDATVTLVGQNLTSGTISYDPTSGAATIATAAAGIASIIPQSTTAASGYVRSMQALLVPQECSEKQFIKITTDAADYFYTPKAGEATLTTGNQYTYHIKVNRHSLSVSLTESTEWTNGGDQPITSKELFIYTATDLKAGDYYYSDGTWSDGGLRKMTADGEYFEKKEAAPDLTGGRSVIGIVFKTGKDGSGDRIDDCDYKQKNGTSDLSIRGYVLALYDAGAGTWGPYGAEVGGGIYQDLYTLKGFYGYKFTNVIKTFAGSELQTKFVATYLATEGYEVTHPAPATTSGWFLPSAGQGQYLLNHGAIYLPNIQKATGDDSYEWGSRYWTSSETNNSKFYVCIVSMGWKVDWEAKYNSYAVRSLLAF